ncbi:hypothetical protein K2173_023143 [Erythroxylum novogranatense]|uniref:ER membrane protein complex subunit 4 n=1 Tax=Erythroxylum novogranatense TaxID=1862640 RepID=A0AAV8U7Z0_9ROSI|nr:hypothetical protein K2173_023143 [Erythroxylum novogranatense]
MDKGKTVMGFGRRWAIDFTTTPSSRDFPDLPPPPASLALLKTIFLSLSLSLYDDSTLTKQKKDAQANWKAQEVAQAPLKNLSMMGFMMRMVGSIVHLFSIGITFSALSQPINALRTVGIGITRLETFASGHGITLH